MTSGAILRWVLAAGLVLASPGLAVAQDIGVPLSPILVIDSDRVFRSSRAGQRIDAELEAQLAALVAENRTIEQDLVAEELALTDQRPSLDPATFRQLADEFDQKVQSIRAAQDAKQRSLQDLRNTENQSFVAAITPILSGIGRERGALVIMERRSVLLSADTIDITEEAIARINASLPEISDPQTPTPQTGTDPDPGTPTAD